MTFAKCRQDNLTVRILVHSSKNCRVRYCCINPDTQEILSDSPESKGFLIPTESLEIIDPIPGFVRAIKDHANLHYDKDGWDYIVETFTDADIAEVIKGSTQFSQALRKVAATARLLNERRKEVESTIY